MNFFQKKYLHSFLVAVALVTTPFLVFSQQDHETASERILGALETLETHFPQQKVFLHIDKEEYLAGEQIWFKAYVVNGMTHAPDTLSKNLHLKLITTNGDIASSLLLRLENGVANGDIRLPDSIAGGNYEIVAYTDWMRNFDERFFFQKDIYIVNPIEENYIKLSDVLRNRRFNRRLSRQEDEMQFAFFPEGGNLLAGAENNVAFKAANALGAGVKATGTITDNNGKEVLSFTTYHHGMGTFSFTPVAGQAYQARVAFENGDVQQIELPVAEQESILLSAKLQDETIEVRIKTNPGFNTLTGNLFLLAQTRGRAYHFERVMLHDNSFSAIISTGGIPTGVCQIVLISSEGQIVAERLVFVNHNDLQHADIGNVELKVQEDNDYASLDLSFGDDLSAGSYSLAIVESATVETDHSSSIVSELLLKSEIGYSLKEPMLYFDGTETDASRAIDLIMMTHGWKRFDLQQIITKDYPAIVYGFPQGLTIRGEVSPRSSARKTGEVPVEMAVEQDGIDIYNTTTNTEGDFAFTDLQYDGRFSVRLLVDPSYDQRAMHIELTGGTEKEDIEYTKTLHTRPLLVTSKGDDWERVPRPETVLSRRSFITPGNERSPSIYSQVDQVIYFDDIRDQYSNVLDVLRTRVRGLRIIEGQITLRGISSLAFTNEPLFIIDETVVGRGAFLGVNVRQIDRLAVMSGAQTAILGSRGTNGALLIYTLRGDSQWHTSNEYIIQGYHVPAESFESKIDTEIYADQDIDRTLFWEPYFQTGENADGSVSFPVDEHIRNIRLIIQGVDDSGRITYTEYHLTD
jgi:hypothetical protein